MAEIENFINSIIDKDHVRSNAMFAELLGQKVDDAIEAEKISVAGQVFNGLEMEEIGDEDISDEDLEAAGQEIMQDEEEIEMDDVTDDEIEDDPVAEVEEEPEVEELDELEDEAV